MNNYGHCTTLEHRQYVATGLM